MSDPKYLFQYVQKIIIFSDDWQQVLLARRFGEADYDQTFSFIGGKMETTDPEIIAGVKREKDEEIGETAKLLLYPLATRAVRYVKKDGMINILPHYLARFKGGEIQLNKEEYSEYKWVPVSDLVSLEPKVENIPDFVNWALSLKTFAKPEDYIEI